LNFVLWLGLWNEESAQAHKKPREQGTPSTLKYRWEERHFLRHSLAFSYFFPSKDSFNKDTYFSERKKAWKSSQLVDYYYVATTTHNHQQ
jgi:hypothetical protein